MLHHYADIRDRIAEDPKWWDEHGVPRYCDHHPDEVANIYARQVAFVEIACQNCGARYLVAFSSDYPAVYGGKSVRDLIESDEIHYGDPPNGGCCRAGSSMNSVPLRVVEFWTSEVRAGGWARVAELERQIPCDWMSEDDLPSPTETPKQGSSDA